MFVLNLLDGPPNVLTGPCRWKPPPVLKVLNDLCEVVVTGPRVKDVLLKLPEPPPTVLTVGPTVLNVVVVLN